MRKSSLWLFSIISILALALSSCGAAATSSSGTGGASAAGDQLSGTISVSGAFALYPMMTVWADQFSKLHPQVQFDVQGGGAGKGMTDVLAGAVDIGMISRAIKPEEEQKGAFWVSVTRDAVFPVVSAQNPVLADLVKKGLTQDVIKEIFITGEIKTWGEVLGNPAVTDQIHVYTRSDSCGAADQWALYAGGKAQADLQGIGVNGEPALVDTVGKDPLGIGYSNLNSVFDASSGKLVAGAVVPPIDINGDGTIEAGEYYQSKQDAVRAISNATYPSPPARFENLATKGKPQGLVLAFIQWILTDGQQYLDQAGYVQLTPDQQAASLAKLK